MIAQLAKAAILSAALAAPAFAQSAWTELRAEHFVVRGAMSDESLQAVACDAQRALRVLNARATAADLSIVATNSERQMWEVLPQFWERRQRRPLGGYWSGIYGHHVAVRVDASPEERLRRLLHEVAHFATHASHDNTPRWLDEGLSELWEHVAIENGIIEIGRPVERHIRALRSDKTWIPVAQMTSSKEVLHELTGANAAMFYAESWALVHYLLIEKGDGTLSLDGLLAPAALPSDDELRAYARGTLAAPVRLAGSTTAGCDVPFDTRRLTEAETALLRTRALADGERPDAARPILETLLKEDPTDYDALETLGFVHFRGNRPEEAVTAFDRVISAGKASHVAYFYRALLPPAVPEREYLCAALRLNPGFRPALGLLNKKTGELSGCAPNPAVPH